LLEQFNNVEIYSKLVDLSNWVKCALIDAANNTMSVNNTLKWHIVRPLFLR